MRQERPHARHIERSLFFLFNFRVEKKQVNSRLFNSNIPGKFPRILDLTELVPAPVVSGCPAVAVALGPTPCMGGWYRVDL